MDADPNLNVVWGPGHNWDVIRFNHTQTDKPWADVRVRKAMAHAVDREEIKEVIYYGGAILDDDPLPAGFLGAEPDPQFYPNTADLDTAKALLADAGYPDGFTMPCFTDDREPQRQGTVLLSDQLAKVGITMEIEVVDRATSTNRLQNIEFDTNVGTWGMASPDSDAATGNLFACRQVMNNCGYCNPDLDAITDAAAASMDRDECDKLYREACQIIAEEDCATVFLCNVSRPYSMNEKIKGFSPGPLWLFPNFKTFYWEA